MRKYVKNGGLIIFNLFHSPRAKHFNSLVGADLADWIASIGLEMYGDLISQLVGTGERLASIADNKEDLVVRRERRGREGRGREEGGREGGREGEREGERERERYF